MYKSPFGLGGDVVWISEMGIHGYETPAKTTKVRGRGGSIRAYNNNLLG